MKRTMLITSTLVIIVGALLIAQVGCSGPVGRYGDPVTVAEEDAVDIEDILGRIDMYKAMEDEILIIGIIDIVEEDGAKLKVRNPSNHTITCVMENDIIIPDYAKNDGIRAQGYVVFDRDLMKPIFHVNGCETF